MTRTKNNEAGNKAEQERCNELNEELEEIARLLEENARLLEENKRKQSKLKGEC